ncbi:AIG2-like family protein [Marinobacter daqiaonensis]|uniref:AIG2-like family protein n=1 Tax=Marinobacter daqiaonensis TaxID=650891 RepID=A0A1I6ICZ0_9GAMM|nr:gamma-glutamylcyclotransferase family protein [Marinobacter daqiaonensis]SFR64637.1 AIG2-like family protein [Marinobacter daqiaonensis]
MLCFTYGSNMSRARLQARLPSARPFAVATLPGHRLRFHKRARDGSAKCDAERTRNPEDRVIGVIYEIADDEKPDLDRYEGLGFGYEQKMVELETAWGHAQAWMYYAADIDPSLKPYRWYREHVLIGAREHDLPPDYIARIEAVESVDDPDVKRSHRELAIYRQRR